MIIKCPNCGKLYNLTSKPSKTFKCKECKYSTPFANVLNVADKPWERVTINGSSMGSPATGGASTMHDKTQVVQNMSGEKTIVVEGLRKSPGKRCLLKMNFKGVDCGSVQLPAQGNFTMGRRSSDGKAQIQLTPDVAMSRIHAGGRIMKSSSGETVYQITTAKDENPVVVNGKAIRKGHIYVLRNGDRLRMGDTNLIVQLQ